MVLSVARCSLDSELAFELADTDGIRRVDPRRFFLADLFAPVDDIDRLEEETSQALEAANIVLKKELLLDEHSNLISSPKLSYSSY